MTVRDAVRTQLLTVCAHVYQPYVPTKDTEKPYIVVRMGGDQQKDIRSAYDQLIQVWLYVQRGNFNDLDTLVNATIDALNQVLDSSGEKIQIYYEGKIGQEIYDPDWDADTQGLEFSYAIFHERR